MPFEITSKTFADEFNTGTTSKLVNAVAGDEWVATINLEWSNIINADDDSSYQWEAKQIGAVQVFECNSALGGGLIEQFKELVNGNFDGATFDVSDFNGTIDGTYTIDYINNLGSNIYQIVCNESFAGSKIANKGRIAITEAITSASVDYRVNGEQGDNDYSLAISTSASSNDVGNFSTTTATLDASNLTPVSIPFKYNGAYQTGGLTFTGVSIANDIQSFVLTHTFKATPISLYDDGTTNQPSNSSNLGYTGINQSIYNAPAFFGKDGIGKAGLLPTFSNQVSGGFEATKEINYNNVPNVNFRTFDKTYIGSDTTYSISNLSIVRTSDSYVTDKPIVNEKFTVTFDVDSTGTPFSNSNTLVKVGIENLPLNINNSLDYEQAFLSDYAIELLGASAGTGNASGDALSISNYTATFNSTSQISVSFDVDFTANAQTQILLDNDLYFSIYCVTQNHSLDYTNSDRTILSVFSGRGIETVLEDPITVEDTKFVKAVKDDYNDGVAASELAGFPVQLVVGTSRFYADWSNRPNLRIDTITQRLVLKNSSTLEEIELEGTVIPVNTFTLIDGEYPAANNFIIQKGFNIPNAEIRNRVRFINKFSLDSGDIHYYEMAFPFFVRWEYYKELILNNVPPTIIDTNEAFDGKNYFVNRIDDITNWSLDYRITFNCSEGATTFEQDFDYTLPTSDYNEHPDVVSRTIKTYEDDTTTLQPTVDSGLQVIDSENDTYVKVEYELTSAPTSTSTFEFEFYLEAFENGSPTKVQRISSVNGLKNNSWFKSTDGSDKIVKSIDGTKAVGVCLIDVNKLSFYDKYRLYPTFYNPPAVVILTFQTNSDVPTDTFSPSFNCINSEVAVWTLIGGYTETINILSIAARSGLSGTPSTLDASELEGTTQDVVVTFPLNDYNNITEIDFGNDNIVGELDISDFTGLNKIVIRDNPGITSVINPTISTSITQYNFYNNTSLTTLDLSGLTGLSDEILGFGCTALTSLTFPTTSGTFNNIKLYNCDVLTSLDFSGMSGLGNLVHAYNMDALTSVTFPSVSNTFSQLWFYNNDLLTSIDLSNLTGLSGDIRLHNSALLASITNPISSETITRYRAYSLAITSLDVSGLTGLSGDFEVRSNSNLTSITHQATTNSNVFTDYKVFGCDLTGTLDLSKLEGLGDTIYLYSNSNLDTLLLPTSSETVNDFRANNCNISGVDISGFSSFTTSSLNFTFANNNLSVTDVNNILIHLDSVLGAGTGTINVSGNSATPTGAGATAKAQLITDGYTVTTD